MTSPKIKFERDWPLWALKGPGWTLPILVEWPDGNDMAAIQFHPKVPLLAIQKKVGEERIQSKFGYFHDGYYRLIGNYLPQIACPAHVENPEDVVNWQSPAAMKVNIELTKDMQEFINDFCQKGWTQDPVRMKYLWAALCEHMMEWMLSKNRILDLGFATLAAIPFRADWKNLFLSKWITRCNLDIKRMIRSVKEHGEPMAKELSNPSYLASAGSPPYCQRQIEVMHKKEWWTQVARIESIGAHAQDYWLGIKQLMADYFPYASGSLLAHIRQVLSKIPFTHRKDAARRPGIPEGWALGRGSAVQMSIGGEICAITVWDPEIGRISEPFDLAGEEEIVSEVRPV